MVTLSKPTSTTRDSEAMRRKILEAVGRKIVRDGLGSVGVNSLAREAGCDKVLIYRYFDDLDGVYAAFAERTDFWWSVDELTREIDPTRMNAEGALQTILRRHARAIRTRPVTLAVLASELSERTALVLALEAVRERRSLELMEWIGRRYELPASLDIAAIAMLLGVAVNYLAVRGRDVQVMSGVKIKTDDDWERLFAALDQLIAGALRSV